MEPERKIEKLLRAFAKKRREQAGDPMQLNGAARQQLHQEISRRAVNKSSGSFLANLFSGLHPRIAFALFSLAIVLVASWFLAPVLIGKKPATLASADFREGAPATLKAPMSAPAPPMAADRISNAFDDSRSTVSGSIAPPTVQPGEIAGNRKSENLDFRAGKPAEQSSTNSLMVATAAIASDETAAPVALSPAAAPTGSFARTDTSDTFAANGARGFSAPQIAGSGVASKNATLAAAEPQGQKMMRMEKAPASPAVEGAFDYQLAKDAPVAGEPVMSQRFNRTVTPATRQRAIDVVTGSLPVLTSFQVEQKGNQIRVVDSDGSIYTGAMQAAQNNERPSIPTVSMSPKSSPAPAGADKTRAQSPIIQNYFFRVAGTNRILNQNVVFLGDLIPFTNAMLAGSNVSLFRGGFGGGGGGGAAQAAKPPPVISPLSNARISGRVTIGNQKAIEVNASPAP